LCRIFTRDYGIKKERDEMEKSLIRKIALIAAVLINSFFSVGYAWEIGQSMLENHMIARPDGVIIDGADFTPLANIMVDGANGLFVLVVAGIYAAVTLIVAFLTAIIMWFWLIRRAKTIAKEETVFARNVIVASSVVAFLLGIALTNIHLVGNIILVFWQQPLFMLLIYYIPMERKAMKSQNNE